MIICFVSISFSYKSTKKVRITGSFAEKNTTVSPPCPLSGLTPNPSPRGEGNNMNDKQYHCDEKKKVRMFNP